MAEANRARTLVILGGDPWSLAPLGINQTLTFGGSASLVVTAVFSDDELVALAQKGSLVLNANRVLRVEMEGGTYDITDGEELAFTKQRITDFLHAGHDHQDAEGGGTFAGITGLTDVAASIGAEAKILATAADGKVSLSVAPTTGDNLTNKTYVDTVAQGLSPLTAVRVATAAALATCIAAGTGVGKTLTLDGTAALIVDGVTVDNTDRVLVKNQVAQDDNGVYTVTDKGRAGDPWILTRATDFDGSTEVKCGVFMFVTAGTANAGYRYALVTPNPIVVDTTALAFSPISGPDVLTAGNGISITSNVVATKIGIGLEYGPVGSPAGIQQVQPDDATGATIAPVAVGANGVGVTVDNDTIVHTTGTLSTGRAPAKGSRMFLVFSKGNSALEHSYLRIGDGVFSNVASFVAMRAGKIAGMSVQCGTAPGTTVSFFVHSDGTQMDSTVKVTATSGSPTGYTDGAGFANNTFSAGKKLSVYVDDLTLAAPVDVVVTLEIEWT